MNETEKLWVNSLKGRVRVANELAERFAWHARLNPKDTMHVCLLVEETLGMLRSMTDDFDGQLWLEGDGASCRIHLDATASMDPARKRRLIAAASSGKNSAPKGFMAKIGRMLYDAFAFGDAGNDTDVLIDVMPSYIMHGMGGTYTRPVMADMWSLNVSRETLKREKAEHPDAEEALDELEKSIVARLADDVVVSVRGRNVALVIEKTFHG